jgi:flagellar motor switch/type III secretory pathway protein FliN
MADIPVEIEVELERKIMTVRDILALDTGGVLHMPNSGPLTR